MENLRKELQVRSRILSIYNKRPEEFSTKIEYDDYLEQREDVIFSLLDDTTDHSAVEARISDYKRNNSRSINANRVLQMEQTRAHANAAAKPAADQHLDLLAEQPQKGYVPGAGTLPPQLAAAFGNPQPSPLEKVELNGEGGFKGRGKLPKNEQEWLKMAAAAGWSRKHYAQALMSRVFESSTLCLTGSKE